jgi:hypothetical protein
MQLRIHSDASYLNAPGARSLLGGHFYLGNKINLEDVDNRAIHNNTAISDVILSSAAEAETAALFVNAKDGTTF